MFPLSATSKRIAVVLCVAILSVLPLTAETVWTHHYDNSRTGANTTETTLTTSNVNQNTFGKLFTVSVDGYIFAQPLYIPGLTVSSATHNVVYVATANNSVYAFDADNGTQLWKTNYGTPPSQSDVEVDPDIVGNIGIIGTPVIDTSTNTMYFVERNKNTDGTFHQFVRAIDITTGSDKFSSPHEITATFNGIAFNAKIHNQRAALTLANGTVYISWASHNDQGDYHGWLMGYQASNVSNQQYVFATTNASNNLGGIWQSGNGLVVDGSNNLEFMVGNGQFDGNGNYGMSFMKLSSSLAVQDYFTPSNWSTLDSGDKDLGSSGPLLIPGTNYLFGGGKDGRLFLVDITNMGKNNSSSDNVHQEWQATTGEIHSGPVYWNSPSSVQTVYIWSESDNGKAYTFNGTTMNTTPSSKTSAATQSGGSASLSISSNGNTSGTGILWANVPSGNANGGTVTGTLHAYDATNLATELWNSDQNSSRDDYGNFGKYCPPVVANGKVYMSTFSNQLVVYGLLGSTPPQTPANLNAAPSNGQVVLSWGAAGGASSYNVYRSTSSGGEGTSAIATGITSTGYTNTGLSNGTKYYFKVAAVNSAGTSSQSNEASATPSSTSPVEANLSSAFNLIGIYNDGVTFSVTGGMDALGNALSGTLLGTSQTWNSTPFIIGPAGANDVISSTGQVVSLPSGVYSSLLMLATAVNGNQASQSFTVNYSDGTTTAVSQNMSDWFTPQSYSGESNAISMAYRNGSTGVKDARTFIVYGYNFGLNTAKTVSSITLPNNANVKVLAISLVPSASSPDFSLSSSPSSLSVNQGSNGTSTISVSALNGFGGSVSLSASGLPSGVTASFNPSSTTGTSTLTLSASSSATTGTATVTITGTSGSLTHTTTVSLTVNAVAQANFSLSSSPSSLTVTQGNSGTSTITVSPSNGFNSSVSLSASGLPSGVTASFNPSSTTGTSTLTLSASSSATTGTATVTITGTSGSLSHTTTVSLTVNSANTGSATQANLSGAFNLIGIYNDGVTFSATAGIDGTGQALSGTLLGTSQSWSGVPFTIGPAGANDVITSAGTAITLPSGTYSTLDMLALAVNGNQASQSFTVTYSDGTTSSFTQSLSDWFTPQSYAGESKAVTMAYRNSSTGVKDSRTFYVYGYSFALNSAKTVKSITPPNNAKVKILSVTLLPVTSPTPSFTLSSSPSSLTINQSANGTSTITVNPSNGFNSSVSLSASGLPSGVTASFNPSSTTGTSTLTLTASSTATTGTTTVTVTGTSGSLTKTTTISLTVKAVTSATPTFTLSSSPSSLTVTQGNNGTSTITVNPANGFNSSVSLSASGMPSGVTASFNPSSTTGTSTLTLTASSSATTGSATVTVTGTSGSLTKTTTVSLTVNASSGSTCDPAWAANVSYSVGQLVSYSGQNYKCLQAHTSQVGWEPPNVPALWQALGACQ